MKLSDEEFRNIIAKELLCQRAGLIGEDTTVLRLLRHIKALTKELEEARKEIEALRKGRDER